jgi:hypothetical protein
MDFVDLYEELEALERRVMVQSLHMTGQVGSRWRSIPTRGIVGGSWRYTSRRTRRSKVVRRRN